MTGYENEWNRYFDNCSHRYSLEPFTAHTTSEVDFLVGELKLAPNARILDVGCGTGRHSVEFARRGYSVTGIDISEKMLAQARKSAHEAGTRVDFICSDAAQYKPGRCFDGAISICEGALSLLGSKDCPYRRDMAILANMSGALKSNARFAITVLNAFRKIRKFSADDIRAGVFDPVTMTEKITLNDDNSSESYTAFERAYTPSELIRMCNRIGLHVDHFWGGSPGEWHRQPLCMDEIEVMIVGYKKPVDD